MSKLPEEDAIGVGKKKKREKVKEKVKWCVGEGNLRSRGWKGLI